MNCDKCQRPIDNITHAQYLLIKLMGVDDWMPKWCGFCLDMSCEVDDD